MRTDKEMLHAIIEIIEAHNLNFPNLVKDIRARLAEPEDEPVAWSSADGYVYRSYTVAKHSNNGKEPLPLYRHPRQPLRLSDEEIDAAISANPYLKNTLVDRILVGILWDFAKAIENAVLEKNK